MKKPPEDEFVYLGSKESYNGKGMSLFDFVRTTDRILYYYDLAAGEKKAYSLGNDNMSLEPIGVVNGYIITWCRDLSELEFANEMKNLKPAPDGTIVDLKLGKND